MTESPPAAPFNRPPRAPLPRLPDLTVELPTPPVLPPPPEPNALLTLIPVAGLGVMALFYMLRAFDGGGGGLLSAIPLFALALFTLFGTLWAGRWRRREHQRKVIVSRSTYLRTLERRRARLQGLHDAQRALLDADFPAPMVGLRLAQSRDPFLWGRRPTDQDFLAARLGIGRVAAAVSIGLPNPDSDDVLLSRALDIADTYRTLEDAPFVLPLREWNAIGFCGQRTAAVGAIRALINSLCVLHAPQDVQIALSAPAHYDEEWAWLDWLPHTSQSRQASAGDLLAFDATSSRALLSRLGALVDARREQGRSAHIPHIILILDGLGGLETDPTVAALLREGAPVSVSVWVLVSDPTEVPGECNAVVEAYQDGGFRLRQGMTERGGQIDAVSLSEAGALARALAAITPRELGADMRLPRTVDFLSLFDAEEVELLHRTLASNWGRMDEGPLPRPIVVGRETLSTPMLLALDEQTHGPHGLIAGTTGAGKSEFLQTLICALTLEHHPRLLSLFLIDFKGGSTFSLFARLPHTVGMMTNLDGLAMERALEALRAEVEARQQFLRRMNARDIAQYHQYATRARALASRIPTPAGLHPDDMGYPPLPHLLVVVDEFAQLAKEYSGFLSELVRIAQVGRSLGLHLILGTQSPDLITEEMSANLQFRIAFRVQNVEASRAIIRRPEAAYLPAGQPGRAYLQVGERGIFKAFQTAYAGSEYLHAQEDTQEMAAYSDDTPSDAGALGNPRTVARAVVETILEFAQMNGIPFMPPLLLPPLGERLTLNAVLRQAALTGWNGAQWPQAGRAQAGGAPVGLLDDIYTRAQPPLWVRFDPTESGGHDGHLLVIGPPGSGKTTLIQTLALSLAMLNPPDALNLYFLSFGSGLNDISGLPHAETVVHGTQSERVRRLFRRLIGLLTERQRTRETAKPLIVLMIDGYEPFRETYYDTHLGDLDRLISEGRSARIYVVLTASAYGAIPERTRALVPQRIALPLGSPQDAAQIVGPIQTGRAGVLGRGRAVVTGVPPLIGQISLPCEFPVDDPADAQDSLRELIYEMRDTYAAETGALQSPSPIRELPVHIHRYDLPPVPLSGLAAPRTPLGLIDDETLSPLLIDWETTGHLVVSGPSASGKTNLLIQAALSAAEQTAPDRLSLILVDFSTRGLRSLRTLPHVLESVQDVRTFETMLAHLKSELDALSRLPVIDQPHIALIIDDYDLASDMLSVNASLLRDLRDLVRLYGGAGLHVWVAGYLERPSDPLIRHLLLKRTGLVFGSREGLNAFGVRVAGLPADTLPVGRAYAVGLGSGTLPIVQTAYVEDPSADVAHITATWATSPAAHWHTSASAAAIPVPPPATTAAPALDIDTDGLLDDLLGGDE